MKAKQKKWDDKKAESFRSATNADKNHGAVIKAMQSPTLRHKFWNQVGWRLTTPEVVDKLDGASYYNKRDKYNGRMMWVKPKGTWKSWNNKAKYAEMD